MFGIVKSYDKGFGWIVIDIADGGGEVFVHYSNLVDEQYLEKGDRVEFQIGEGARRGQTAAMNVKLIEETGPEEDVEEVDEKPDGEVPIISGEPDTLEEGESEKEHEVDLLKETLIE